MDKPDGGKPSIQELLANTKSQLNKTDKQITKAEDSVAARNRLRMGADRSIIAWVIIGTYAAAVVTMVIYIISQTPGCSANLLSNGENFKLCSDVADERAKLFLSTITTAVLPIVTLMLGFYFGVEKAERSAEAK